MLCHAFNTAPLRITWIGQEEDNDIPQLEEVITYEELCRRAHADLFFTYFLYK